MYTNENVLYTPPLIYKVCIKERRIVTDLAGAFHKNPRTIRSESPAASAVG